MGLYCPIKEKVRIEIKKQSSLRFSTASHPSPSSFCTCLPSPQFPSWLTQHPQSLLAPLVPRRKRGVVDGAGDERVVIAGAHLQGELAAHVVRGVAINSLHHLWTAWGEENKKNTVRRRAPASQPGTGTAVLNKKFTQLTSYDTEKDFAL